MGRTVSDATPSQGADGHEQMGTSQTWSWEPEEACAPDNRSSPTHGESEQLGELLPASHFTRRSHMALMGRDVGGRLSYNRDFVRDSTQSDRSCKGSANCLARVSRA
ncbi:hypothetical protein HaLaN_23945, partial [Haematococcus lacustris]